MQEKFYISTAIAYVNSRPHIGFALELAQADAIARWQRLNGKDVFFLTGTDEHGAKITRAAQKAGKDPQKFVDENSALFKKLVGGLDISADDFIRTSDSVRHFPGSVELWKKLESSGDIYKKNYRGLYCVGHEAFVTQKDLVDGKCADHDAEPEVIEEENYFFRLSKYADKIKKALEIGELKIFPESRKNEIVSFLDSGVEDVSFSRPSKDISWGIPVPGGAAQTMYVLCDALANYISALGYGSTDESNFFKFWPADLHIIGKDILRFHAAIWPAMLLSAGLPLPKAILVHGLIRVGERKMSKTLGNVVNPMEVAERYGLDPLRYYLARELPIFEEGDFTEEKYLEAYEGNLVNGLGNYTERVFAMIKNYFGGEFSKPEDAALAKVPLLKNKVEFLGVSYYADHIAWPEYHKKMQASDINGAADTVFELISRMDGYIQDYEPFKLI